MTDLTMALAEARQYAAHSYAANTHAAYASDWSLFRGWCAAQHRRTLPATPETVLGYVVSLAAHVRVTTIDRRLCGIRFYHRQARLPDPTSDPEVQVTMRGLRRLKGVAAAAKQPITVELLRDLVGTLPHDLRGLQARAVLLLGFAGAFRRSELVALQISDLHLVPEGLIIQLRRSKTDQEGVGMAKGIPAGQQPLTCPVQAVQTWMQQADLHTGWLFRAITPHGALLDQPMRGYTVARIVQRAAQRLGLDWRQFGGHSLRAGLVTAAAQAGVPERIIMQQTGHTDVRMLRRYIRDSSLFRENAAAMVGL